MKVLIAAIFSLSAILFFACGDNVLTSEAEDSDNTPGDDGKTTGINECSFWTAGIKDENTGLTWRVVSFKEETDFASDHECKTGYAPNRDDFKTAFEAGFFKHEECDAAVEYYADEDSPPDIPPGSGPSSSGVDENDKSTEPDDLADPTETSNEPITGPGNQDSNDSADVHSKWQFCVEPDQSANNGGEEEDPGSKETKEKDYFTTHNGVCSDSDPPVCGCPADYIWDSTVEKCSLDVDCREATKRLLAAIEKKHAVQDQLACEAASECTTAVVGPGAFCPTAMNNDTKQRWDELEASEEYKSLLGKYNLQCPVPEGLCAPDGELVCSESQCKLEFN